MHCSLHWLHCPSSAPSLGDRFGARPASLAAGGEDPSPFSFAEARSSRTTVVFWTEPRSWYSRLHLHSALSTVTSRYMWKVPSCRCSSPGSPFPLSTVTYRYLCIRDMVQHPLLTAVELNLHFALDYLIRWDYISIRGNGVGLTSQLPLH